MRIYITGFMGSGKSTFAKALAEEIGYGFLDLDAAIETGEKTTIQKIFKDKGEEGFRTLEHDALLKTEKEDNLVIATGGGAPCHNNNMEWMNNHGITIYLKLFESELKRRIEPEMATRPLLNGIDADGLDNFIYNTLRERSFFYHQSKIVIDPLVITPEDMAGIVRGNYM
jgi:shikimate kinase